MASSHLMASVREVFVKRPTSTRKFFKFGKLPPELRRMIWTLLIPTNRIVRIGTRKCANLKHHVVLKGYANLSVLLSVNNESRQIALNHFTFAFHNMIFLPVYFNFRHDTLLFEDQATCNTFLERIVSLGHPDGDELAMLRHVMVKLRNGDAIDIFDCLGNLDTLTIGFDYPFRSSDELDRLLTGIETYCMDKWEGVLLREAGREPLRIELMEWRQMKSMVSRIGRAEVTGIRKRSVLGGLAEAGYRAGRLLSAVWHRLGL